MLPSLTVVFFLGLLCGSFVPFFPTSLFSLLAAVAIGLSLLEFTGHIRRREATLLYTSLLCGVLYWSAMTPPVHLHEPPSNRRNTVEADLIGRIVTPVEHGPGRQTIEFDVDRGVSEPLRIRLTWREPDRTLHHGDRIGVLGRYHPPYRSLNPGGFDYASYLEQQGIDLVATVTGGDAVRLLESGADTWRWFAWNQIDHWRATIRNAAVQTLDQPALGIFLGIVIGERGYLQQEVQEWFMATGTVHLLSISGSHLGLVALVVFWLARLGMLWLPSVLLLALSRTITPTKGAILLTWPLVTLYTLLAGAELATLRSLMMITLVLVTLWLGHERRLHHALAAAALMIALHDPRAIFDISFQLSFLSVLVILEVVAWRTRAGDERRTGKSGIASTISGYGRDALVMSASVTVATLPVVAFYFNQVPWLGAFTNLAAIPFTGVILVPLGLMTAGAVVLTSGGHLPMGSSQELLLTWMVKGLQWCAGFPGGEWHVAAPSLPAMILFYTGLGVALRTRESPRLRILGAGLMLALVCWWVVSPRPWVDNDRWRVTFLDVGQGDSAVLEVPGGKTVLIDGGARYERLDMGRGVVAPFLWNRGIRHLDHVVATHLQLDHVGGLIWLLRHVSVGQYWDAGIDRSEHFVADLMAAVNERQVRKHPAVRGENVLAGGPCQMIILNPGESTTVYGRSHQHSGTLLNDQSIVSRLECGQHSILFAADVEVGGLQQLGEDGRQPVTLLKVPHHGARSSLDRNWIGQIRPQYAVISVGRANPYGHPVESVLHAYEEENTAVYRTDVDGAIWATGRVSTGEFAMTRMRDWLLEPVQRSQPFWPCEQDNWRRLWLRFLDRPGLPFFMT